MAGLEGTVHTPFGPVNKKTALIVGGLGVGILAIGYYRYKKTQAANATAQAGASVGIDPATGFLYGSAEDAAALTNQGAYISPGGTSSVGGSGVTVPTGGFVSNAQWSQAVVQYMQSNNLVADTTQLTAALGKYIAGSPVSAEEKSLIEQGIALEGYPPVPGGNGYPPSINQAATPPPSADSRKGPPYPFSGSPAEPYFSVTANSQVDGWIIALQNHGVHTSWSQVEALNGGAVRAPGTIWGNIKNNGSGKPTGNFFISAATYRLPPQTTWYK